MTEKIATPKLNANVADLLKRAAELLSPGTLADFHRACDAAAAALDAEADRQAGDV